MKQKNTVYIGLGSNKGNKFENLQQAVDEIFNKIGTVLKISKVYKTPALDFNGDPFNNACIKIETTLSPKLLLKKLLDIEKQMGRESRNSEAYENRVIDLDILFFNNEVINDKNLTIPHPKLQERLFVLQPLAELEKELEHPVLKQSVALLLNNGPDQSKIEPLSIWLKNPKQYYKFSNYNYIAIEGNIGAGKTSLANQIAEDFNAKPLLERFADNPFLPKFYKAQKRYAFILEMSFLADRHQQISEELAQLDLFKDFIISDYDIHKSLIFSKITLEEEEFKLYRRLFYQVYRDITKPDLYIYLIQSTAQLQQNIKKRGRNFETNIPPTYLDKINEGYLEFLKTQTDLNIKIIDVSGLDFVAKREDYISLLHKIME